MARRRTPSRTTWTFHGNSAMPPERVKLSRARMKFAPSTQPSHSGCRWPMGPVSLTSTLTSIGPCSHAGGSVKFKVCVASLRWRLRSPTCDDGSEETGCTVTSGDAGATGRINGGSSGVSVPARKPRISPLTFDTAMPLVPSAAA